jgi:hypothetical protein
VETVKTVWDYAVAINTPLKRGVNEKRTSVGGKTGEKCRLKQTTPFTQADGLG